MTSMTLRRVTVRGVTRGCTALLLVLLLAACGRAEFTYADGSGGNYDDWRGNWVFVNYWAEWCAPCRHEIPELNALHDAHDESLVIGVNFDGIRDSELQELIARMDIAFPVVTADPHAALGVARPQRLPTTYVIDPDGIVVAALEGPQTQAELEQVAGLTRPPTTTDP